MIKTLPGVLVAGLLAIGLLSGCQNTEPDQPASEPAEADVVATGSFVDKGGQHTSGTYRIERADGDLRLVLSDDFATDEGPDLHVVLSPTAVEDAENETAMAEGATVVALLGALSGGQTFDLPDELDVAQFRSVVIHCVQFTHLYGAAPLP